VLEFLSDALNEFSKEEWSHSEDSRARRADLLE
jgi:hypothetical protein